MQEYFSLRIEKLPVCYFSVFIYFVEVVRHLTFLLAHQNTTIHSRRHLMHYIHSLLAQFIPPLFAASF